MNIVCYPETSPSSRVSYKEEDLRKLPFNEEGYNKLLLELYQISMISSIVFPFVWKTGVVREDFNLIVQETWHFNGVHTKEGEVIIYRNSPTSSAHEVPNSRITISMGLFNLNLTNDDSYPIDSSGSCSIIVNDNVYVVDGSWNVHNRTTDLPSIVLEHSYSTSLTVAHNKLISILTHQHIKCGILFDTHRQEGNSDNYALIVYIIRKHKDNSTYIPYVISYGNIAPTISTITFINSIHPIVKYGIGLSENYAPVTNANAINYQLTIHSDDLFSNSPNYIINDFITRNINYNNTHCNVDLIKIRESIFRCKNRIFC